MNKIEVFYDIISPYSYLGLELFAASSLKEDNEVVLTPVALGKVLQSTGNPGPAGIEVKRGEALRDCCMQAQRLGVELMGPPTHPFNTLPALRFISSIADQELRFTTALAINRACWAESRAVDTEEAIQQVLLDLDLMRPEWQDIYTFIKESGARQILKKATARAIELQVFGVPTFRLNEKMNFWGSDRLELLSDYIERPEFYDFTSYERMLTIESGF